LNCDVAGVGDGSIVVDANAGRILNCDGAGSGVIDGAAVVVDANAVGI